MTKNKLTITYSDDYLNWRLGAGNGSHPTNPIRAKLATETSLDPSKKDGGNVGWVVPAQILPAISNVMVNLAKGALAAAPIQTPAGWNILKLEETRPFKAPTFDEDKNDIRQMLVQKQRFDYVKKLRENAKVVQ